MRLPRKVPGSQAAILKDLGGSLSPPGVLPGHHPQWDARLQFNHDLMLGNIAQAFFPVEGPPRRELDGTERGSFPLSRGGDQVSLRGTVFLRRDKMENRSKGCSCTAVG